jgi:hypothetical protein
MHFLESFLSGFFHEKNIKWLLLVGSAIVFGSSLMLVTRQWSEWPSEVKFFTILSYTVSFYGFAELCRYRLQLRTTTKVMQGLTLLLLPICFLAHRWLNDSDSLAFSHWIIGVPMLLMAGIVTPWIASRILKEWLHRPCNTFLASYVILCFAGALPHATSAIVALTMSGTLWLVMTIGVIKINRHVFWLTEEHRMPKVFGFFPILLLGLQFITLMSVKTLRDMPLEWLGMGCVFLAMTVFLTARTVANVFRQRTGELVYPWPLSIVMPVFVGLALTTAGVVVSFYGFSWSGNTTYAAVPTALLASIVLLIAGRDTKQSWFVYMGLILIVIAYQCIPTLAGQWVQQVKNVAAHGIQEDRLPIAFYGLTYLPLIMAGVVAYLVTNRNKQSLFAMPIKHCTTALAVVLLMVSLGHIKAILCVSAIHVGLFALLAIVFDDRRYSVIAVLASVVFASVLVPGLHAFALTDIPLDTIPVLLSGLALGLASNNFLDRRLDRVSLPATRNYQLWATMGLATPTQLCQIAGNVLAVGATSWWVASSAVRLPWALSLNDMLLCGLLTSYWAIQTVRFRRYDFSLAMWLVVGVAILHTLAGWVTTEQLTLKNAIDGGLIGVGLLSLLARGSLRVGALRGDGESLRFKRQRLLRGDGVVSTGIDEASDSRSISKLWDAFVVPLHDTTSLITYLAIGCLVTPELVLGNLDWNTQLPSWSSVAAISWLGVMCLFDGSRLATLGLGFLFPLFAALLLTGGTSKGLANLGWYGDRTWLPIVWVTASGLLRLLVGWRYRMLNLISSNEPRTLRNLKPWVDAICSCWCLLSVGIGFWSVDIAIRMAACLGLFGLYHMHPRIFSVEGRNALFFLLFQVQALYLCLWLSGLRGWTGDLHIAASSIASAFAFAFVSIVGCIAIIETNWIRLPKWFQGGWPAVNRAVGMALMLIVVGMHSMSALAVGCMAFGFLLAWIVEWRQAIERRAVLHAWSGLFILGVATCWGLAQFEVAWSAGLVQLTLIGCSLGFLLSASGMQSSVRLRILVRPLTQVGLILPAFVSALAILDAFAFASRSWSAIHELSWLFGAGIYLHRSYRTGNRYFLVLASIIVNASLAFHWYALGWNDLQLYLVPIGISVLGLTELMSKELPKSSHDPLRYIGALTVLVSPLFEIVQGSWLHLLTLMVLSVVVILLSIGFRLRALMYTGTAFLLADLTGMVIKSSLDNPTSLWVCGLAMGVSVIALAAYCERHRELVLAKIRYMTAELATWR